MGTNIYMIEATTEKPNGDLILAKNGKWTAASMRNYCPVYCKACADEKLGYTPNAVQRSGGSEAVKRRYVCNLASSNNEREVCYVCDEELS